MVSPLVGISLFSLAAPWNSRLSVPIALPGRVFLQTFLSRIAFLSLNPPLSRLVKKSFLDIFIWRGLASFPICVPLSCRMVKVDK